MCKEDISLFINHATWRKHGSHNKQSKRCYKRIATYYKLSNNLKSIAKRTVRVWNLTQHNTKKAHSPSRWEDFLIYLISNKIAGTQLIICTKHNT